jgi:glycosyltransferase involved in cell wall biosynthesis
MYIGDLSNTGFGTVSAGLLYNLHRTGKYDILHLGINYNELMPSEVPWKVISSGFWHFNGQQWQQDDPYGTMKTERYIENFDPDVFMVNNDFPVADKYWSDKDGEPSNFAKHRSKKILYAPLDSEPCPPFFATSAKKWDMVIMYTHWQRAMMADRDESFKDAPVLYHGYDPQVFAPMDKQEARERLTEVLLRKNPKAKLPDLSKKYIVYFNGTNQFRKDLWVLFRAFADFRQKVKNAFLIPHTDMVPSPGSGGWYLPNLAGMAEIQDLLLMNNAHVFQPEEVALFYNSADVMAYPTRGEGFGLPSFEAMATKTPAIVTKFGPQEELHKNGRGYFIRVQEQLAAINHGWTLFALPDWRDLARQLYHVYANEDEAERIAERAFNWVQQFSWQNQGAQLDGIIQKMVGEKVA